MAEYQTNGAHPLHIDSELANKRKDSFDVSPSTMRRSSGTILRDSTMRASSRVKHELSSPQRSLLENEIKNVDGFLDYVAHLRLRYMPHPGSKWDRVLQWAEFFASAVHHFQAAAASVMSCGDDAAQLIWGSCRVLLEMGMARLDMIHTAFALFNDAALMFAHFSEHQEIFGTGGGGLQQSLATAYADLVGLVVDVSLHYVNGGSIADFDARFARRADALFASREYIIEVFWKTQLQLRFGKDVTEEVEQIRRFLSPADTVVRGLLSKQLKSRERHVEFTCEWFDAMLREFTAGDDNVFLVTGKPGCGKTVLSQWIMERLRRQQDQASYNVACFFVEGDFKTEVSPLSIARGLLLQVFDSSIGDVDLYEQILALKQRPPQDQLAMEQATWSAIEAGLRHKRTMLIVDGLDKVVGGEDASVRVLDRLHSITSKSSGTKAIVLSEPLKKAGSHRARLFTIDTKHVHQDMERVLDTTVSSSFPSLSQKERINLVQRLVSLGDGSFAHAMLLLEMTKREKTLSSMMSALDRAPRTIAECGKKLVDMVDMHQRDTRSTVAWLLAAQRPLTVREIRTLIAVDTAQLTASTRISDAETDLRVALGPLIRIHDGVVRFRFPLIQQQLAELAAAKDARVPFNMQEANYDMVNRCLADVKMSVTEHHAPMVEPMATDVMERMFSSHSLLEYTARYWAVHFMQSPMYMKDGKHKFTSEFKYVFPASTTLAVLEHSCWTTGMVACYNLALHLRRTVAPDHEEAIFQSLVSLARCYQLMSHTKDASIHYHDAFTLGVRLFGKQSSILATVVAGYIDTTQATKDNLTTREELLEYLVGYQRHVRGASAQHTIRYARILVQLYKESGKMTRAIELEEELHQMCIEHYGTHHAVTEEVLEGLMALLKESGNDEQLTRLRIAKYERARRTLSLTDASLVKAARDMVAFYEKNGQEHRAEEILTELWQSLTQAAQSRTSVTLQERKLEVAMAYQQFLHQHGRAQDAQNVLVGVWTEYQDELDTENKLSEHQLRTILAVGRELQQHRLLDAAKNVFSSMWSYLRRVNEQDSKLAMESAMSLSDVSRELIETKISTTVSTSTAVSGTSEESTEVSQESIDELEEILESITAITNTMATGTTTTTTTSTSSDSTSSTRDQQQQQKASSSTATSLVTTAGTLSSFYVSQKQWRKATTTSIKALEVAWPSVLATSGSVSLPPRDSDRTVAIVTAKRLAHCYFTQRQITKAEHIHVRVFQATKTLGIRDERCFRAATQLIDFYETVFQFDKQMDALAELYAMQKKTLSPADKETIRTAYRLARGCHDMQRDADAEKYFVEIVSALRKAGDDKVLERDAVEAAFALCGMYVDTRRWAAAGELYAKLWRTVLTQNDAAGYGWTQDRVERLYVAHGDLLRTKLNADAQTQLRLAVEYQKRVVELFGEDCEVAVKATLQLAEMYERSEEHASQAVSLYEKALAASGKMSSSTTTTTTSTMTAAQRQKLLASLTQSRQRLANLYSKQKGTSSKGLSIYREEITKTAATHGFASGQAMRQLSEFCANSETKESRSQAVELLQTAIRDIVVKERSAEKQVDAAHSLVRMYVQLESRQTAVDLHQAIRRQIVSGEYDQSGGAFNLQGAGQHSFAFVVAFEEALADGRHHFSELMATLMTERLLHQNYTRAARADVSFETLFGHGARLVAFYAAHGRADESKRTETDLLQRFARVFEAQATSPVFTAFFHACLAEMGGEARDTVVIRSAAGSVLEHLQAQRFREAYELSGYVQRFLQLYGAFDAQENVSTAFRLALWLAGRGTEVAGKQQCADKKLRAQMGDLSAAFLRLAVSRLDVRVTDMPLEELNELVGLLGEQRNWEALESILSAAWSSRHHSKGAAPWPAATVVALGARLVQVRFQLPGCRPQALHLAADIAYNLRRTWGLHDAVTLDMLRLLAGLYAVNGETANALEVRQSVLRGTLEGVQHGVFGKSEGAEVASREFELLKQTHAACGGWSAGDVSTFGRLQVQLNDVLGAEQKWKGCKEAQEGVEGWKAPKGKDQKLGELEKVVIPESWEFLRKDAAGEHRNNLRRTSGLEGPRSPASPRAPAMLYSGGGRNGGGGRTVTPPRERGSPDIKGQQQKKAELQQQKGEQKKGETKVMTKEKKVVHGDDDMLEALEGGPVGGPIGGK
ncbi:hypothetical protein SLS55_000019 [Diplodia seriata]|uniref:Nephrocystin 3-like N-terminal domain-containing protein n=1 Tax=Diplodia seriata TaxID=420778 RepID=A0ABR3CT40_9PEZI